MSKFNFLSNNFPKEIFCSDAEQESHNMNVELFLAVLHCQQLHRYEGGRVMTCMAVSQNPAAEPGRLGRGRPVDGSFLKRGAAAGAAASPRVAARKRSSQCLL